MANCNTATNFAGRSVTVGWIPGCGDDDFANLTYEPLGTVNSKDLSYAAEVANTNNDQSAGVTSEIIVRTGWELTVSGFLTKADAPGISVQNALIQYYWAEVQAGRQPSGWIKISGPEYPRVWYVFVNYKGGSEGFGTDDAASGEFTFGVTDTGAANLSVNVTAAI